MDLIRLFTNWGHLVSQDLDVVIYFWMAVVATLLFVLRLAFSMLLGGDGGMDMDMDVDVDSTGVFGYFSVLSILAFFMGAGWMGLGCRIEYQLGKLPTAALSVGTGVGMMLLASLLMVMTRRLHAESHYDVATAVGRTGRGYLTVPAKGAGRGPGQVPVSGRRLVLAATSTGPKLEAFTDVTVISADEDGTLVVEPKT